MAWPAVLRPHDALDEREHLDAMVEYRVCTRAGSLGVLDGWQTDEHGRPAALLVAQGWFGRRRLEIPVEKLVEIDHDRGRIVLADDAAPLERGLVRRLLELPRRSGTWGPATSSSAPRRERHRPVLCAVADDARAPAVVAVAAELAKALDSPLVLAHVPSVEGSTGRLGGLALQNAADVGETRSARRVIDALLSSTAAGVDVSRTLAPEPAARTLQELAEREDAAILVMGSGDGLTHDAPCPVVLVPQTLWLAEEIVLSGRR